MNEAGLNVHPFVHKHFSDFNESWYVGRPTGLDWAVFYVPANTV